MVGNLEHTAFYFFICIKDAFLLFFFCISCKQKTALAVLDTQYQRVIIVLPVFQHRAKHIYNSTAERELFPGLRNGDGYVLSFQIFQKILECFTVIRFDRR